MALQISMDGRPELPIPQGLGSTPPPVICTYTFTIEQKFASKLTKDSSPTTQTHMAVSTLMPHNAAYYNIVTPLTLPRNYNLLNV